MSWVDGITSPRIFRAVGVFFFLYQSLSSTWRLYKAVAYPPEEFIFGVNQDLVLGAGGLVAAPIFLYWWWKVGDNEEATLS